MGVRLFTQTTTLAAGASCGFDADSYFAILATSGALTLKARGSNDFGAAGSILPGRVTIAGDVDATGRRSRIGQLIIQNDTSGAVTFTVATSSGEIIDVRGSGETGLATDVEGPAAEGTAPSGNPVRMAGSDGTLLRTVRTDTTGRQLVAGDVAAGVAPTANPVGVAGFDGTLARRLKTDANGNPVVVGAVAAGSAIGTTAPVLGGGSDGTNVQRIRTDTVGNQVAVGAVSDGSAVGTTAPLMAAGSDGTNVRRLATDLTGSLCLGNPRKATYTVNIIGATPSAANYILAAIEAGASKTLRLRRVIIHQVGVFTAAARCVLSLLRTTAAATGGAVATPTPLEAADGAYSGLAKITNPAITAGTVLWQGSIYVPTALAAMQPIVWDFFAPHHKPIVVAAGVANGIAFRADGGAAGAASFDASLVFTEE